MGGGRAGGGREVLGVEEDVRLARRATAAHALARRPTRREAPAGGGGHRAACSWHRAPTSARTAAALQAAARPTGNWKVGRRDRRPRSSTGRHAAQRVTQRPPVAVADDRCARGRASRRRRRQPPPYWPSTCRGGPHEVMSSPSAQQRRYTRAWAFLRRSTAPPQRGERPSGDLLVSSELRRRRSEPAPPRRFRPRGGRARAPCASCAPRRRRKRPGAPRRWRRRGVGVLLRQSPENCHNRPFVKSSLHEFFHAAGDASATFQTSFATDVAAVQRG